MRLASFGYALCLTALSACGSAERISETDQATLDCLASLAVAKLSIAVKTGLEDGTLAEDPRDIQKRLTQEGLRSVKALFPAQPMHNHYYEFNVANRSLALQKALKTGDSTSDEYQRMTETLELGETCEVEGLEK
jgi:hypothetical protein